MQATRTMRRTYLRPTYRSTSDGPRPGVLYPGASIYPYVGAKNVSPLRFGRISIAAAHAGAISFGRVFVRLTGIVVPPAAQRAEAARVASSGFRGDGDGPAWARNP